MRKFYCIAILAVGLIGSFTGNYFINGCIAFSIGIFAICDYLEQIRNKIK